MTEINYTVERDEAEVELTIRGNCTEYVPANFSGHPDNWFPAEGGDSEIEKIVLAETQKPWNGTLTEREEKEVLQFLCKQAEENIKEAKERRQVDAHEDRACKSRLHR